MITLVRQHGRNASWGVYIDDEYSGLKIYRHVYKKTVLWNHDLNEDDMFPTMEAVKKDFEECLTTKNFSASATE